MPQTTAMKANRARPRRLTPAASLSAWARSSKSGASSRAVDVASRRAIRRSGPARDTIPGRRSESLGVARCDAGPNDGCRCGRFDITVRAQEVGEGPPVVFIPGAQTAGISWAGMAAGMAGAGFRCILIDRPGTGLSSPFGRPPDARGLPAIADALLVEILDALELEAADVVATSLGRLCRPANGSRAPGADPAPGRDRLAARGAELEPAVPDAPGRNAGLRSGMAASPVNRRSMRWLFRRMGHGPNLDAGRITDAGGRHVRVVRATVTRFVMSWAGV